MEVGALDKRALSQREEAIVAELEKKVTFMYASKGYIPMLDHSVLLDAKYELLQYFLKKVREYGEKNEINKREFIKEE